MTPEELQKLVDAQHEGERVQEAAHVLAKGTIERLELDHKSHLAWLENANGERHREQLRFAQMMIALSSLCAVLNAWCVVERLAKADYVAAGASAVMVIIPLLTARFLWAMVRLIPPVNLVVDGVPPAVHAERPPEPPAA